MKSSHYLAARRIERKENQGVKERERETETDRQREREKERRQKEEEDANYEVGKKRGWWVGKKGRWMNRTEKP